VGLVSGVQGGPTASWDECSCQQEIPKRREYITDTPDYPRRLLEHEIDLLVMACKAEIRSERYNRLPKGICMTPSPHEVPESASAPVR